MAEDRMLSDEILLGLIKKNSGGGGGGTTNYNQLENKPQIGGVTLTGNKTASDLGLASEDNLAGKQDVLTAGDYVNITNDNVINVRVSKGTVLNTYRFTTQNGGYAMKIEKFVKGVKMSEVQYSNGEAAAAIINIDGVMEFGYKYAGYLWYYKLLTDSREHVTDQVVEWYYSDIVDKSENFDVASDASKNIVLQEDLTDALAGKQDKLTFDDVPTANSNNPVKSNGIYDALALKQDATDNSLQTTDKTVVGAVNELKSGLINVDVALSAPENSGKNLLPLTLARLKEDNTDGTWADNVYTYRGVTFTVSADANGLVTDIVASGTASANWANMYVDGLYLPPTALIINGLTGGSSVTCRISLTTAGQSDVTVYDGDKTFTALANVSYKLTMTAVRASGDEVSGLHFKPMIRLSSVSDPTFAPYIPSVESRIEAVESGEYKVIASVTADGVKTMSELLTELYSSIDGVKKYSIIYNNSAIFNATSFTSTTKSFGRIVYATSNMLIDGINITSNGGTWREIAIVNNGTVSSVDRSSEVIQSGRKVELVI